MTASSWRPSWLLISMGVSVCIAAPPRVMAQATAKPAIAKPATAAPAKRPATAATPATPPKTPVKKPVKPVKPPPKITQLSPAELGFPKVLLSEQHAQTCKVNVGDELPDFELPDLAGKRQMLASLLGEKLTVVVFWKANQPYAVEELGDMGPDVIKRFSQHAVRVVGINERDTPAVAQKTLAAVDANFPNLLDSSGAAFAQCATSKLPRTYLIDPARKILWFDMEYSRSTRRDLERAIRLTIKGKQ